MSKNVRKIITGILILLSIIVSLTFSKSLVVSAEEVSTSAYEVSGNLTRNGKPITPETKVYPRDTLAA